jgi:hypothetical protein
MKNSIYLIILLTIVGCNRASKPNPITRQGSSIQKQEEPKINRANYVFDNSVIPEDLISYVKAMNSNLRLPTTSDYDDYFFTGYYEDKLPYFCTGEFNNDSIKDFALILIKDTTDQLIYSFHADGESYTPYLILKQKLTNSQNKQFKVVSYSIRTETERILEAIDTTYVIDSDGIITGDMDESLEFTEVWDKNQQKYISLIFD